MAHGHPLTPQNQTSFDKRLRADLGYCPYCGKEVVCICPDVILDLSPAYIEAILAMWDEFLRIDDEAGATRLSDYGDARREGRFGKSL